MPFLRWVLGGQHLKGECKNLTDGGPVETELIIYLHVLIWDAQEVLNNCGICWNMEKNKGLLDRKSVV